MDLVPVSKRLWDLARANLNDFASALLEEDDDVRMTAEERRKMEEEIEASVGKKAGRAARKVRSAAEDAWERAFEASQARRAAGGGDEQDVARWYKTLELEPDADLDAVRKAYKKLMRKYHPDRFASDPEKYEAATKIATKITAAYNGLRTVLEASSPT